MTIIEDKETLKAYLDAPNQSKVGVRDKTLLAILFDTAMRVDELVSLKVRDVASFSEEPFVFIKGKGAKQRRVGLHDKTILLINEYKPLYHPDPIDGDLPFLYTIINGNINKMSTRNVERITQKYADKIRKDHPDISEHVHPHVLRRTRATNWYRDNIPIEVIATLLGHEDIETTRNHYAKPSLKQMRAASEKGTEVVPESAKHTEVKTVRLWESDEEFAKAMGMR